MQKKIIALAVAAAFSAPAFADTTVYGQMDAAVAHISADGQNSGTTTISGGLAASRFGIKAAEDLNNGMKAVVVMEYGIDGQTATSNAGTVTGTAPAGGGAITAGAATITQELAARQKMLALAGDMGTFATGYLQTTGYDWENKYDPLGGSAVSPLQSMNSGMLVGTKALAARAPRALAYISPEMAGVTVAVNYTTDFTGALANIGTAAGTDTKKPAYLLSAMYNGVQNLSVGAVYAKLSTPGGTGDVKDFALGASYDLTVVKLSATYQTSTPTGLSANKAYSLSALAPVGPGAIAFQYAKGKNGNATGQDGSGYTLGYLQGLSKTTTAYVMLEKVTNGSAGTSFTVDNNAIKPVTAGGASTLLAVGLNKKF